MKALLDFPIRPSPARPKRSNRIRVATYLHDTAAKVHLWYHKAARAQRTRADHAGRRSSSRVRHRSFCATGYDLLGISAPERM
jgi:arginyl-tRNA synthetase